MLVFYVLKGKPMNKIYALSGRSISHGDKWVIKIVEMKKQDMFGGSLGETDIS